jgi:hypothetical protein
MLHQDKYLKGKIHHRLKVTLDKTPLTEASRNRDYQKERLNSDGQQYHQYQQNKQSPLT